jgi:PKHD-type hydroxylase
MEEISKWFLIMNYGLNFKQVSFNNQSIQVVRNAISSPNLNWKKGSLYNTDGNKNTRSSEIAWLGDKNLLTMLFSMQKKVNVDAQWNLNITGVEPVQFGIYGQGDFYDWHVDQHPKTVNGNVRKISMSLFLNDDFEGGEFDLEIYKPGADPRYETFKSKPWTAIFFQGDQWHRVRPVTSGLRKSLVAWFYGPPYS